MKADKVQLTARDWIVCCGEYTIIISIIAYLFYDSILSLILFIPFIVFFIRYYKAGLHERRIRELKREFLRALQSLSTSLAAGLSPENALNEALIDMERMYGSRAQIVIELRTIKGRIYSGIRMEDALLEFGKRSQIEAINDFAVVFCVAKRSGGSFVKAISDCVDIMNTTREMEEEIEILIRGKQYEMRIMSIVPLGIVLYFRVSSGSFINSLYHNYMGIFVMTVCLIVYLAALYMGERLCNIRL